MINIKSGTQTWSNSTQRSDFKSDGAQTVSASDRDKMLGTEDMGEILNKVADPNFVDTSKKMRTAGSNQLSKDAFMNLLLTQMKNQDPTNPLKSHEMAAQLAQFTSLEKLTNINDGIDNLRKDQQPSRNYEALSFIGKTVTTDNSKISRTDKDAQHDVRFMLPADAQKLTMKIKDAEGNVVRTMEYKNLKTGKNALNWNGNTEDGSPAPVGEYSVAMEATGSNGKSLFVQTRTEGVISGINFTPQGPQLLVGKQVISLAEVKSISEPGLLAQEEAQSPAAAAAAAIGARMMPVPGAVGSAQSGGGVSAPTRAPIKKADNAKDPVGRGNLENAAMAQGLINKLNKEGAKAGGMGG